MINIKTIRDIAKIKGKSVRDIVAILAVTGSGFSKRELFSNDDYVIYNFKRCIGSME